MPKYEPYFVDGKPTDKFKRRSSLYEKTVGSSGKVEFQVRSSLMTEALGRLRDEREERERQHQQGISPTRS